MTGPLAGWTATRTTSWGVEKQARERIVARSVRILGLDNRLIEVCPRNRIERYLNVSNVQIITAHGGKIVGIRLLSIGDDTGHLGELHESAIPTTHTNHGVTEHRWVDRRNVRAGIRNPYSKIARELFARATKRRLDQVMVEPGSVLDSDRKVLYHYFVRHEHRVR